MSHGFDKYGPEVNALRNLHGCIADLRHECGRPGDGWDGLEVPDDLAGFVDALESAVAAAERMRYRWADVNRLYDGACTCAGLLREARAVHRRLVAEHTTRTILRRYPDGPIIAIFPDIDEGCGNVSSYMHVGQHGPTDRGIIDGTRPVDETSDDAVALLAELRRVGYLPKVVKRWPSTRNAGVRA